MFRKRDKVKRILLAIKNKAETDNVFFLSSSVSYYCFLSFIPLISVLAGIYIILNVNLDWNHFSLVKDFIPPEVYSLVERQARRINSNLGAVNVGTIISLLISLWLANNVTRALAQSLNIVFGRRVNRHYLFTLGESVVYTLGIIFSVLLLALMLTVLPIFFALFKPSGAAAVIFFAAQWLVVFIYMIFGLCFIYKYLPSHGEKIPMKSFLPGAFVATIFGSVLALLFSFYVGNFASINKIYGALGAVVVFLLWLRLTFASVLFGGEINYFLLKDPELLSRTFSFGKNLELPGAERKRRPT